MTSPGQLIQVPSTRSRPHVCRKLKLRRPRSVRYPTRTVCSGDPLWNLDSDIPIQTQDSDVPDRTMTQMILSRLGTQTTSHPNIFDLTVAYPDLGHRCVRSNPDPKHPRLDHDPGSGSRIRISDPGTPGRNTNLLDLRPRYLRSDLRP